MSNYILIKAPNNQVAAEQLKQKLRLLDPSIQICEKDLFTCGDSKYLPTEQAEFARQHAKLEMARDIGNFLLEQGYIKFSELEEPGTIRLDARLTVVKET